MADPTPGISKTVAALAAGAVCTLIGNVINHIDPDAFTGWALWLVLASKQSDSMSAVQTLITTSLVYFVPHGGSA